MVVDIKADILPNVSLGNILLRDNINDLKRVLKQNEIIFDISFANEHSKRVSLYSIFEGIIIIAVDNFNDKVFRITAKTGYHGKLLDKIQIGDTLKDVCNSTEGFYYDEREDLVLSNKFPGVSLELDISDYLITTVKNPIVENISVFAIESMTVEGQRGNW